MLQILIVDDDEIIRKVMVKTFGKYGTCNAVTSGRDALNAFNNAFQSKEPYGLLILDLSLDDISGLDILKAVRKAEKEANIEATKRAITIMVTGNSERDIVKECIVAGCNDYILKPLKPDTARQKLEKFGLHPIADSELKENEKEGDANREE